MIRYALKCKEDHSFDSWFQSAAAFEKLERASMVACPVCGSTDVSKSPMAPGVQPARSRKTSSKTGNSERPLQAPASEAEANLAELRRHIEANSDYVGLSFTDEARKMHDGEIPHRSIYGEAASDDARKLLEDGIPVAPLPFIPPRKTN